jgi:hypothetical protein
VNLCGDAESQRSNIGCEYWAVDLDNAVSSSNSNAAAQPFSIVVSNAEADVSTKVTIDVDDAEPGTPARLRVVGSAMIAPRNLEVFYLGSREVDGSADGTFNTGTGTALSRHAFRIRASMPIVAYQFNPLENVNVFSNDASQLLPVSALGSSDGHAYVVASWPQTIATSLDPAENFGVDLRTFVAVVATRPDTHVKIKTRARVIPGGPLPAGLAIGEEATVTLQPFEVLNLESGAFNADFTGSIIDADKPVAMFPGSEASDAPFFSNLGERSCCADHLEEQGIPIRAAGKSFVLTRMPNRTRALAAAGANIGTVDEPEFYRVVATRGGTHVVTTLPAPDDAFDLDAIGDYRTLIARSDFTLQASEGVIMADVQASQEAAGVPRGLPGGDPSLTFVPPVEQWRSDYVLLTPDKYAFDYLVVAVPAGAHLYIDSLEMGKDTCELADLGKYVAYRCQLSYPIITSGQALAPGRQNDGVHRVQSDLPVGVIVYGFDSFVSYAYPGGTQLREINAR